MKTAHLRDAQQGHAAFSALWPVAKAELLAGRPLVVTIAAEEETRSQAANALLHAALGDVAAQVPWGGRKWDKDVWKRLMVASWCRARGELVTLLPALDGHGVDVVFRHTSTLTKSECSDLVEYVIAWGAANGVKFTAPEPPQ